MNTSQNVGWMDRVLDALRSPGAMMVALVLALFPQGEHTAQVFIYFSHDRSGNAQLFAYAFAAAVEVAVLLFVLAGHKRISYLFAGASFLTNVVYYAIGGVAMLTVSVLPVLLLSALLPACIMGYSHTIAEKPKTGAAPIKTPAKAPRRLHWQFWRKPAETPTTNIQPIKPTKAPVALPVVTLGHQDAIAAPAAPAAEAPDQPPAPTTPRRLTDAEKQTIINMSSNGMKGAAIAKALDLNENTVRSTIARASKPAVHHNGIAKEPTL